MRQSLCTDFLDEHLVIMSDEENPDEENPYAEVRKFWGDIVLPPGDQEKQRIFLVKESPYTLVRGILFKMGLGYKLRRCVNNKEALKVIPTFHLKEEGGFLVRKPPSGRLDEGIGGQP